MKHKRHKHVRKQLGFYKHNFRMRPPYRILLDGTFCLAALHNRINISDQMPKYLEGGTRLITTECALNEVRQLGHPILSIWQNAIVLEKPSRQTLMAVERKNETMVNLAQEEYERVRRCRTELCVARESGKPKENRRIKRTRNKNKNPLSCLLPKAVRLERKRQKNLKKKARKKTKVGQCLKENK